jgi:hypothetical protein
VRTEIYTVDRRPEVYVFLSRRNLSSLLAKLDGHPPNSACQLIGPDFYPLTHVIAEEDDWHYSHGSRRGTPPGRGHTATEEALRAKAEDQPPEAGT